MHETTRRAIGAQLALGLGVLSCGTPVTAEPSSAAAARVPTIPSVVATASAAASAPGPAPAAPVPIEPAPLDGRRRVTLAAAGDLVPNGLAMRSVRSAASEEEGYRMLLSGYAAALRDDEIAYLNLEVPLVDDVVPLDGGWPSSLTERPRRAPVLGATPTLATVLAALGVDVVGLGNNHAFDQGNAGLRRTRELAIAAGLAAPGAGETATAALAPVIVERGDVRVAFVSLTTALNRRASDEPRFFVGRREPEDALAAALADARAQSDVVVALVHWSVDFVMEADGEERSLGRWLVDAGADIVLGTGPHVLHEVVRVPSPRGEALIAYSLGNLASGMGRGYRLGHVPHDFIHPANVRPEARDGLLLRVAVLVSPDGRIELERVEGVPLWTENDYLVAREHATVRVVRLADASAAVCTERLPIVRRAIGDEVTLDVTCP